jgi:hypothetical protein
MSVEHRHGRRCYWDHLRCGWVCMAEEDGAVEAVEAVAAAPEQPAAEPVPVAAAVT